ncbi:creatininase family protein [Microbacterium sp. ISL-59]|uniref:creatininase family protein n=1 Tax=Microbacterium sp. ISL-59 TaxID=2819159 RepID=UPI001BEC5889|nr:creatininase family protein [Microbacterium sp. ISL-59]MBT2496734.1 creatininase family protein [Microbacterium sp. ISL-59]
MVEIARLTTEEAAARFARAKIALIPIGAIEQHGPHLELRTDIAVATEMARRVDAALAADSLLCPPMPYGASEHHLAFSGTLSLRPESLRLVLRDICLSLIRHGIDRVLIVNGHGGNCDIARLVAREVGDETGRRIAHVMWDTVLREKTATRLRAGEQYHHACEVETSLAFECDAELVRVDRLTASGPRSALNGFTDPPGARFDFPRPFEELSADGALGDPSRSDPAWGAELVESFVEQTVAFARWFQELPPRSPNAGPAGLRAHPSSSTPNPETTVRSSAR